MGRTRRLKGGQERSAIEQTGQEGWRVKRIGGLEGKEDRKAGGWTGQECY
jgi:hypothetical protein